MSMYKISDKHAIQIVKNLEHIKRILQKIIEFEESKTQKILEKATPQLKEYWREQEKKAKEYLAQK